MPTTKRSSAEFEVLEQAAEWFGVLGAGDATAAERAAFQDWLQADPAHRAAWQRVEQIHDRISALPGAPAVQALTLPPPRRRAMKALALLCTVGGAAALLASRDDSVAYLAAMNAGHRTAVGETAPLSLPDGSQAWLNTASAADVVYDGALRRIALRRGEILIHSHHDAQTPARPLVLDVPAGRLTALGTRFAVLLDGGETRLAVYDGAVRIQTSGGQQRIIDAGSQVRFTSGAIGVATAVDENQAAWRRNILIARQMRLQDVLAELARYRHGYLGCDPALDNVLLLGSYPLDDTEMALQMLEASLPVRVHHRLPWWVTVTPR
ncbi:DUF4880 domain-containing protein [Duganella sp. FT80W]|uniref:DUF4880 domain-containing protein n=1 Tax=Duganella guangzhouensis TaxID=2666084 RepID=A0A6I2L1F7_9BURK|nr:FecR domain-containing protein [Duganella guangzhouensis]MRW92028.1 DUF4880 domain-containing protein [Duganella guangzhouensis]